jgi:hypothetical protein
MTTTSQQYKPFGTYHFILGKVTASCCLLIFSSEPCAADSVESRHHVFELHGANVRHCAYHIVDSVPSNIALATNI